MPELSPPFKQALEQYERLKRRYETRSLSQAEFAGELKKLTFSHEGRYWSIGASSGTWFVHAGGKWIAADPPVVNIVAPSQRSSHTASRRSSKSPRTKQPLPKSVWVSSPLEHKIKAINFLPDSVTLIATCFDPDAAVVRIGATLFGSLTVSEDKYLLDAVAVSGDGRYLFCGGIGRTKSGIWIWKTDEIGFGQHIAPWSKVFEVAAQITCITSSHDGSRIAAGLSDGSTRLIESSSGREIGRLPGGKGSIGRVAMSADARFAATSGRTDTRMTLWDISSGLELHEWNAGIVDALEFSRDGHRLLATARGSTFICSIPRGNIERRLAAEDLHIDCAAFTVDGQRIVSAETASGRTETSCTLWSAANGDKVRALGRIEASIDCIASSRNGAFAAFGASDRRIHVLSL